MLTRRSTLAGLSSLIATARAGSAAPQQDRHRRADHTISITNSVLDLGPDAAVSTTLYNGLFPGPLLRLKEGVRTEVYIENLTDRPEQLHWHGQNLNALVDGAAEEGTPFIPARGTRRISFVPGPSGFRFYHTHKFAGKDLSLGLYSGQVGLVYVEPVRHAGAYDQEVFIVLKEFGPYLTHTEMMSGFLTPTNINLELRARERKSIAEALRHGRRPGYELAYNFQSINGRMLGHGDPIRVRNKQRVRFHILNASATQIHSLALPGHVFRVVALDGNDVPSTKSIPVLWLAPAERICADVDMLEPGIWILGEVDDAARNGGMGIVVEYASEHGPAQWRKAARTTWDYRQFSNHGNQLPNPDENISLLFETRYGIRDGFDEFTINGMAFSMEKMQPTFRIKHGRRYRLTLQNATDDVHPIHLHRHTFDVTSIAGSPVNGLKKDVLMVGGFQEATIDFTANQKGLSLFHCHMQSHMDLGFMALFECQ